MHGQIREGQKCIYSHISHASQYHESAFQYPNNLKKWDGLYLIRILYHLVRILHQKRDSDRPFSFWCRLFLTQTSRYGTCPSLITMLTSSGLVLVEHNLEIWLLDCISYYSYQSRRQQACLMIIRRPFVFHIDGNCHQFTTGDFSLKRAMEHSQLELCSITYSPFKISSWRRC